MRPPEPSAAGSGSLLCPRCGHLNPRYEPRCVRCQVRLCGAAASLPVQQRLALKRDWPKVIPFELIAPERAPQTAPKARPRRTTTRRPSATGKHSPAQFALDLQLPPRLPVAIRPAHHPEAPPAVFSRRMAALALDAFFILAGFALFLAGVRSGGAPVAFERAALPYYGLILLWLALFYKCFWCLLNYDSPGLKLLGLRLVRFDRRPPSWRERTLRLCAACLTTAGLGAGLWWALLARERLTWYDLISHTCVVEADRLPPSDRPPATARR